MTIDDVRLGMWKVKNLRRDLMDSYTYLIGVGNAYDRVDREFIAITESLYDCILQVDKVSEVIDHFANAKARNKKF